MEATVLIYMDQYRKAKAAKMVATRCHDQEKLYVNWNPAIRVIPLSCYRDLKGPSPQLPEDFAKIDIAAFHDHVYALASQI